MEKSIKEHEQIVQAIINQNKQAAREHAQNHVLRTKEDFLSNINSNPQN